MNTYARSHKKAMCIVYDIRIVLSLVFHFSKECNFCFLLLFLLLFLSVTNWAQNIHSEWKILWLMHSIDCSVCYFVKCEALHTSRKAIILSPKSFFVAFISNIAHFFTSKLFSTDYLRRFKFLKKAKNQIRYNKIL